jgi:hypothetical protein
MFREGPLAYCIKRMATFEWALGLGWDTIESAGALTLLDSILV